MEVCQSSINERTTDQHISVPKRCCYCIPHRLGLFVLAVLKLILSFALLMVIILTLYLLMIFTQLELLFLILVLAVIAIVIGLVDIFLGFVAIVSICMKNQGKMKMYHRYTGYVFGSLTFLCCVILIFAGSYYFSSTFVLRKYIIVISTLFCILLLILERKTNKTMPATSIFLYHYNKNYACADWAVFNKK